MNTSNEELRSSNKDFSDQPTEEHGVTDSSGDESLTPSAESDFTTDITRRLSTLQIDKSTCKAIGCHIQSNDYMIVK